MDYRNVSVSKERLGGDGFYYTRVRAKPAGYFDGNWSEWSSNVSFTIKSEWRNGEDTTVILCLV